MHRREALKLAAASVLGAKLLGGSPLLAAPPASGVRFSFMLWALQQQAPFDRCIEIVAEAGYQGIELVGEFQHWSPEMRRQILARLQSLGLVIDAMSGVQAGFAVPQQTSAFLTQFADHLRSARELGCSRVILLSGARVPGMLPEAQRALAVDNLKQAAAMASKQAVEIVIEPIDLLEQPTIFLASVTDAFEIAHAVGAPNLKVLYDLYHEQRSFGNLIEKLEKNIDLVGLIHVADVPGRHQPGTGEIDYANIFRKLAALKYNRWIAMEYYPTGDPVKTLRNSRMEAAAMFAS